MRKRKLIIASKVGNTSINAWCKRGCLMLNIASVINAGNISMTIRWFETRGSAWTVVALIKSAKRMIIVQSV